MTTLAIIGSGILGRSLIYALAKEQRPFEKITLFYSDKITAPCTFHSTAIVAPRGLTAGISPLGDYLLDGFGQFCEHVENDNPHGVEKISQYTAGTRKIDELKSRYPHAKCSKKFFHSELLMAEDDAFLIDPIQYCEWLMLQTVEMNKKIEVVEDFVTEVYSDETQHIKTLQGKHLTFDKVIFAGGNYNRFWKNLAPDSKLKSSKPVQGSYYEFNQVNWLMPSFSLTLDGDNLIWNKTLSRLLIGSTSLDTHHLLAPQKELEKIYQRLSTLCDLNFPEIHEAEIKVGLREKAQKREPYIVAQGQMYFLGGLYKNGFSLALKVARNFSHQYL